MHLVISFFFFWINRKQNSKHLNACQEEMTVIPLLQQHSQSSLLKADLRSV